MGVVFIRNVPDHIQHGFKVYCAKKNTSMNKELIRLMEKTARAEIRELAGGETGKSD